MKDIGIVIGGIFLVVIILILIVFTFEAFRLPFLDLRREGNQRSQQYVETTVDRILQLKREYDRLETDILKYQNDPKNKQLISGMQVRQINLINEMEVEVNKIPRIEVPQNILDFLMKNGRLR